MAEIKRRETKGGTVRWDMRVYIGRDPTTAKRRYITRTFGRKGDADKEARRLERMRDHGALTEPSRETLSAYLARWLDAKEGEVRARTIHDYRGVIRRYIENPPAGAPPIGSIQIHRLTPQAFEALYTFMRREAGLSPRTIQYLHAVLRQALGDAVKKRALPSNPTDYAKRPTRGRGSAEAQERKAMRAMSKEQAAAFLAAARSDRYFALWAVLLTGGLRPGEALGLGWSDVDFEGGRVHVRRTLTRVGVEGWKLVEPKTDRARRSVVLPPVAIQALKEWRAKQHRERLLLGSEWENHGLVFTNQFGRPLDDTNLSARNFRRIMAKAGLGEWGPEPLPGARGPRGQARFKPAFRMYDLRHTCATLLLLAGENPKIVSERLGHASITLTLDTYSHVLPSMQESSAAKLEAMFGA